MPSLFAHASQLWYALPLVVSVSLVYAATRHEEMPAIVGHATRLGFWIITVMAAIGLVLWWLGRGL